MITVLCYLESDTKNVDILFDVGKQFLGVLRNLLYMKMDQEVDIAVTRFTHVYMAYPSIIESPLFNVQEIDSKTIARLLVEVLPEMEFEDRLSSVIRSIRLLPKVGNTIVAS